MSSSSTSRSTCTSASDVSTSEPDVFRDFSRARKQQRIDDGQDPRAARLQRVINIGGTSDHALRKIVSGLDEHCPRAETTSQTRQAKFASMAHRIPLALNSGGEWSWELCNPGMLMTRIVGESPALQQAFAAALRRRPSTPNQPWGLLVGFDEHIPGNKLALQNSRKCMNLSFSFEELGAVCVLASYTP